MVKKNGICLSCKAYNNGWCSARQTNKGLKELNFCEFKVSSSSDNLTDSNARRFNTYQDNSVSNFLVPASEVRKQADDLLEKRNRESIISINKKISESIVDGYCYIFEKPSPIVIGELKKLGYEVEECDNQLDGYCLTLKW